MSKAQVSVAGATVGGIGPGLLVFLGISRQANEDKTRWLADKVANLRIFPDQQDRLNLSVKDSKGAVLVVSQFTLWGEASKGNRPSFSRAALAETALPLYHLFIERLREHALNVEQGKFGAVMQVELINDGPVTMWLEAPHD